MTVLESQRLILDAARESDVPAIADALADFDIAKNLATAPHPYSEKDARDFLVRAAEGRARGEDYCFAIRRKTDDLVLGCCGLHLKKGTYEIGYWIAKPFWRQGFATEAAARLVEFAFADLKAAEVWAGWYHDNPFSGRVLGKLGFTADHVAKQHSLARGVDVLCNRARLTAADFGRKRAA